MKSVTKILCCLLIAAAVFSLGGCKDPQAQDTTATTTAPLETDVKIDWLLHGTWVTGSGEVQKKEGIDLSVSGKVPLEYEPQGVVELEMDFVWPETSGFRNEGKMNYSGSGDIADAHNGQAIYHGGGWLYEPATNKSTSLSFTLCPDEGFMVFSFWER